MEEMPPWLSPPQPPSPTERLLSLLKRHGFTLICLILAVLFAGLLLSMNRPSASKQEVDVDELIASAEAERAERLAAAAQAAAYREPSTLSVLSYPEGATVFLNHDSVGATPLRAYPVSSGAHVVSVAKGSLAARDTLVVLEKGRGATLSFVMQPASSTPSAHLAGVDETGSDRARASKRAITPDANPEAETGFVRVSTDDVVEVPSESEPAARPPERATPTPSASSKSARNATTQRADAEQPGTATAGADSVLWLETEAERQQRVSGYVRELIQQRERNEQAVTSSAPPLDSSELPLEVQQEQAREIIRKHEGGGQDSTHPAKKPKKRRGWW